jgi:aminoglycoside phosphotransferase (APT) family kinase protein
MPQAGQPTEPESALVMALRAAGLVGEGDVTLTPLTGGVSCDVWKVAGPRGSIVVKRPLPQLRVQAEWHAPVERGMSEIRWLRRVRTIQPDLVPEVLAELPVGHAFAMRFLPDCPVWKDQLMAGHVDGEFARQLGRALAAIHSATAHNDQDRADFPNDDMFFALRVDPFLLHVARNNPAVAPQLNALVDDLRGRKMALVHGDVSPKNILVSGHGPVILDAECAVYGDPAFDLAFCTAHLLLKSVHLDNPQHRDAASAMVAAYRAGVDWEDGEAMMQRTGALCAALLLARIDGKSPAPYLTNTGHQHWVRGQATALIVSPQPLDKLVGQWKRMKA